MRILKETELRKVKVLGSGAFGTVYKVRGGAKVPRWAVPEDVGVWPSLLWGPPGERGWCCLGGQLGWRLEQGKREWRAGPNSGIGPRLGRAFRAQVRTFWTPMGWIWYALFLLTSSSLCPGHLDP